ncbi:MAG: hypothetical protein ACOC95_06695 [Planctomycetota bacterium]
MRTACSSSITSTVPLARHVSRRVPSVGGRSTGDPTWQGKREVTVVGPADISFDEAARQYEPAAPT